METTIDTELDELIKQSISNSKRIVIYNDDVNTFESVIDCLVKYCKHSSYQAEQCAMIIHYNGKCSVKEGQFNDLLPIYTALLQNKLNAEIQ
jgi:ATP-dependent Clp protease adaptor protein ClpS